MQSLPKSKLNSNRGFLESAIDLQDIESELQKSLQEDDIDTSDDGLKQLPGFKLLVNSIAGIDFTRQDSLALIQEANIALVGSNYTLVCHATCPTNTEELVNSISTINSERQASPALEQEAKNDLVESDAASSDAAACQQHATFPTDTTEMPCARHDASETISADPSHIVQVYLHGIYADVIINSKGGPTDWHYVDDEPLIVDDRLVVATDNAKERTRVVEEQLRSRKLRLDEIQEKLQINRSIRLIQKWFLRKIFIRRASICLGIIRIICRGLIRRGFRAFCRWKASIQCQRVCRGFVIRRRLLSAQKQRSSISMCKLISRVFTRRGFLALYHLKAAVVIQRIYRRFVIRMRLLSVRKHLSSINMCELINRVLTHCDFRALHRWKVLSIRKHQAIIHMCLTLCRALSRRGFLTLYRWNAAVRIQHIHRGFIIRKRLLAIRNRDFAYVDSELDSLLCADIADLLPFDDKIEGESDWKPSMPISLYVNTNRVNIGPEHICEGSNDAHSNQDMPLDTRKVLFSERSARENENNDSGSNMHEKKVMSEWRIKDSKIAQVSQTSKCHSVALLAELFIFNFHLEQGHDATKEAY